MAAQPEPTFWKRRSPDLGNAPRGGDADAGERPTEDHQAADLGHHRAQHDRPHGRVRHLRNGAKDSRSRGKYALYEDGGGFHDVHVNTVEGFWSLLRSRLRPHRGISQEKLPLYLGFFQFVHKAKIRSKGLLNPCWMPFCSSTPKRIMSLIQMSPIRRS